MPDKNLLYCIKIYFLLQSNDNHILLTHYAIPTDENANIAEMNPTDDCILKKKEPANFLRAKK